MELAYIREFIVLAETGNFSRAAEKLSIPQPLLTRHIKKLEADLGVSLFDRSTRSVALSEEGQRYLPYARIIAKADRDYDRWLKEHLQNQKQSLVIGIGGSLLRYGLPAVLTDFIKRTGITPEFVENSPENIRMLLRSGEYDLAISCEMAGTKDGEFIRTRFATDSLAVVLPTIHPLAHEKTVSLDQLAQDQFILLSPTTQIGAITQEICKKANFQPQVFHVSRHEDSVIDMVKSKLGISILLKHPHISGGIAAVDMEPAQRVDLNILQLNGRVPSPATKAFLDIAREHIKRME